MIGWIILGVLLGGLAWLLWTPLRLEIDSGTGVFRAEWRHLCAVQWLPDEGLDIIRVEAPFFRRNIRLSGLSGPGKSPDKKPEKADAKPARFAKKKQRLSIKMMWRLGRNFLRSFKIKRLQIWWDSDDFIWNARAYPIAHFVNTLGIGQLRINFVGRRDLALVVENRLGRMLGAVLFTFITKRSIS